MGHSPARASLPYSSLETGMSYDRTRLTLGQLLTSEDSTIKRNAMSILKTLTGCDHTYEDGRCIYCFKPRPSTTDWKQCKHEHTQTDESMEAIYCRDCGIKLQEIS